MTKENQGIQQFRLIAAVMVIAIHCLPFQQLSPEMDGLITLTLFRVAVPFFFMVTGFFVLGPALENTYPARFRLRSFLKKQLGLYMGVNLLFLPLAFYNGSLSGNTPFSKLIQLGLFDGFLYHLWYFPAIITGVILLTFLMKKLSFPMISVIAICLYLIGLGGDSWFGIIKQVPLLNDFYARLFHFFGGTRNGLFFAPLFLCLGAFLYRRKAELKPKKVLLFFAIVALLLEGYLLHRFSQVRHDSMYLTLPLVMVFLFPIIYQWQPKLKCRKATDLSLGLYILHPYTIAITHFISKKWHLLKDNLLNFLLVSVLTFVGTVGLLFLREKVLLSRSTKNALPSSRASKTISTAGILHNLREVQQLVPKNTKIMAVIKTNAYGCDSLLYGKILEQNGVDFFAVATLDEAISLRKAGIKNKILILGYTSPKRIKEIADYPLIQAIISEDHARKLNQQKIKIACHLKVDTGMHRLGVKADCQLIRALYQLPYLDIQGIFSHLGSADQLDKLSVQRTEKQIRTYDQLIASLRAHRVAIGLTHLQSSDGILNYPKLTYDYVRPGIILYGMLSKERPLSTASLALCPVITINAQLIYKAKIVAGDPIGYGIETVFPDTRMIGVVSIGYGDGIPRSLAGDFSLSHEGQPLPQVGQICMDMLLVDLTRSRDIAIETELTVISDFPQKATELESITNELLSRLGNRLDLRIGP
ncbi:membrane-bound serine racemase VanT [Vagococcus sp. BWB3-3]|uniref:Membrane-bound serine racemase VanT n=1 Tax=Vagococcus allomyrinae TaxID=2794353 RepID=A0A940P350_9ENTE|nr:membrane-bound serine racemase VanT [Vagococcus allomyrinae]MBP1040160.1 membrane-bound serine racemase VanT [Vagococcus allomyrinae]